MSLLVNKCEKQILDDIKHLFSQVAIKTIRKERITDDLDKIHIQREIEITSSLQHSHIIRFLEGNDDYRIINTMIWSQGTQSPYFKSSYRIIYLIYDCLLMVCFSHLGRYAFCLTHMITPVFHCQQGTGDVTKILYCNLAFLKITPVDCFFYESHMDLPAADYLMAPAVLFPLQRNWSKMSPMCHCSVREPR